MLASIQKINKVSEILGADKIDCVQILGWDCVVKKGEFKLGDLCVYIEPDTIIPKKFLDSSCETDEKIRLKVIKMKGQISQGLVLPISNFLELFGFTNEGDDVADLLNITKYEKQIPANMQGDIKGNFPYFIPKTDEIRIQSEPELLEKLIPPFYITIKLDGTSGTYYKFNQIFGVCSRNMELKEGENVYWRMAEKYKIKDWLPEGFAIQGEICGPGIQGNKLGLIECDLFAFNFYDIESRKYIVPNFIASKETRGQDYFRNIQLVPAIVSYAMLKPSLEELIKISESVKYENNTPAEGIVVRSIDQKVSFKVINTKFCLKYGE